MEFSSINSSYRVEISDLRYCVFNIMVFAWEWFVVFTPRIGEAVWARIKIEFQ